MGMLDKAGEAYRLEKTSFKHGYDLPDVDGEYPDEDDKTGGGTWKGVPEQLSTMFDVDSICRRVRTTFEVSGPLAGRKARHIPASRLEAMNVIRIVIKVEANNVSCRSRSISSNQNTSSAFSALSLRLHVLYVSCGVLQPQGTGESAIFSHAN